MKSVKGTQTEKNLLTSFAGESQARNRYTFFASAAKKEGYYVSRSPDFFRNIAGTVSAHRRKVSAGLF